MKRVYGVPYYAKDPSNLEELWYTRDQDAQGQVVEALRSLDMGYEFVWNIYNNKLARNETRAHDLNQWTNHEMGLCCTRIPVSDPQHPQPGHRDIIVKRRGTSIEGALITSAKSLWEILTRRENVLMPEVVENLPDKCKLWRKCVFHMLSNASLLAYSRSPHGEPERFQGDVNSSMGYLYYTPKLGQEAQCSFLSVFSHAGYETLTWAHLIRWRLSNLLEEILRRNRQRVVVACFRIPDKLNTDTEELQDTDYSVVINAEMRDEKWYDAGHANDPPYTAPDNIDWLLSNESN